jgi:hypothetical protein
MLKRFYDSVRGYLGGMALALGSLGLLVFVFLPPGVIFIRNAMTGLSPNSPGMSPAAREEAISRGLDSDLVHFFIPWFLGSIFLITYGFYEAYVEKKAK